MRQSLFWRDARKTGCGSLAKGAAGCCEDQAADFAVFAGAQALVDGVVFGINREQGDFGAVDCGHYYFSGGDQHFFIG